MSAYVMLITLTPEAVKSPGDLKGLEKKVTDRIPKELPQVKVDRQFRHSGPCDYLEEAAKVALNRSLLRLRPYRALDGDLVGALPTRGAVLTEGPPESPSDRRRALLLKYWYLRVEQMLALGGGWRTSVAAAGRGRAQVRT